ncbi:MAG: 16S rRNA (cytosine(1402)-N(4))-methyltransferase RsmH [Alphaproteobacteria bacterium]
MTNHKSNHIPVMTPEMIAALNPKPHGVYIDGTFGGGGHTRAILHAARDCRVIAFDRDPAALPYAHSLSNDFGARFQFIQARFSELEQNITQPIDGITLDLGLSSIQLNDPNRGFSFERTAPLNMNMENTNKNTTNKTQNQPTVATLLAAIDSKNLAEILKLEGEEPQAKTIARAITQSQKPILTTTDLKNITASASGAQGPRLRKQLARVFQALRRHINNEAAELEAVLLATARLLAEDGRCVVISFHSLEDRVVKQAFAARNDANHENHSQKPFAPIHNMLRPGEHECKQNSRARSARLRAARRTNAPAPQTIWWKDAA